MASLEPRKAAEKGAEMEKPAKTLFPIVSNTSSGRNALFPVASMSPSDSSDQRNVTSDLDWLENKSYLSALAQLPKAGHESYTQVSQHHHSGKRKSSGDFLESEEKDFNVKHDSSPSHADVESYSVERKKKKRSHKEKKHKKHKHKKSKSASFEEDLRQETKTEEFWKKHRGKTFLEEIPGLEPESAFRVDRTKDRALWDYDSIYKDKIARYTRLTNSCLGNPAITISNKKSNTGENKMLNRYYSKENRRITRVKGQAVRPGATKDIKGSEYISVKEKDVSKQLATEPNRLADPLNILDTATSLYVKGQGKSSEQNTSESIIFMDETFEKISFYNRHLSEDPNNVKLWIEFVKFQDVIFQNAKFSSQQIASRSLRDVFQPPRVCIEKKLAILDKALAANPSSLQLKITKLELQQDIVDSETLTKEWDNLLFSHSGDIHLWRHYLIFQQSRLSTFSVGRTVKLYHRCFKTLRPIMEGSVKVVKMMENLEDEMIELFVQYCTFLHHCGFTEKAVASYQALIEFNLFRPTSLNLQPTTDCISIFESFWDSGVPRFGEPGALGWAAWVEGLRHGDVAPAKVIQVKTDQEQEDILAQNDPVYETWIKLEQLRETAHWLPWRPDVSHGETEEDCEDLDRLVLYDDIAPVLFHVQKSSSCFTIVAAFLQILGLGVTIDGCHCATSHSKDFDQVKLSALHQISAASGVDIGVTADPVWKPRPEIEAFIEEVLRQAVAYFSGYQRSVFALYQLQLHREKNGVQDMSALSTEAVKAIRKYGKNLLKELQNRNNLILWNEYIRSEWALNKTEDALAMLQTALCMFSDTFALDDHNAMAGMCSLYRTYAEIQLNFLPLDLVKSGIRRASSLQLSRQKAVSAFFCLADRVKFSPQKQDLLQPPQMLRTRKKFQTMAAALIDSKDIVCSAASKKYLIQLTCCSALFELCCAGIDNTLQIFDSIIKRCDAVHNNTNSSQTKQAMTELCESLYVELLLMLKNYMNVEFVSLTTIRSHLQTALSCFPNNTKLLRELIELEERSHMAGRMRRYFDAAARDTTTPYPVLFEVLAEMSRHVKVSGSACRQGLSQLEVSDTGTLHRVRAVCERGLQHQASRHCPLLWRMYLKFEVTFGSHEKAKGIFYRALQTCPWAKVLYLDGAVIFGPNQVQELIDLMTEKEIRLQIPLEEVSLLLNSEPQNLMAM